MTTNGGRRRETMRLFRGRYIMRISLLNHLVIVWFLSSVLLAHKVAGNRLTNEDVDVVLDRMEAAAEAALAERTTGATKYKELVRHLNELIEENKRLEELEKDLVRRTFAVDDLVRQANAVQLKYLASQMNLTIKKELEERESIRNKVNDQKEEIDVSNAVTLDQLEEQTLPTLIMDESEKQLEAWILNVIEDEIAAYHAEAAEMCSSGKCVTPVEAAQLVQASLSTFANDGVNMVDHAKGATIVYELTSETYVPPNNDPEQQLGNVWWRKYIPQDWERVLPSKWEEWKIAVPSFLKHSFGRSSDTVPPEAILTAPALPGSCWPMSGRNGQVTIRLPYLVNVKALSVDHASSLLVGHDRSSAPRSMRIIAYPPCEDDCNGIGFDVTKAWELTSIDYDVEGGTTQIFDVPVPAASCSEEAPSCEAEPDPIGNIHVAPPKESYAAAVTVAIEDNWGKDEYTCLYRIRIHGDAAPST